MKLLAELLSLREEAIEVRPAEEVWKENKDDAKTFIPTVVYSVKENDDADPKVWEVYKDADNKRKLVGKFETSEFEDLYVPVRANQNPDAEGYTLYRDNTEVEAFKYDGDTVKLELDEGGKTTTLNKGDYLIRETEDDNFVYEVQSSKYFETDFTEKK